jgi:hypothetical protein
MNACSAHVAPANFSQLRTRRVLRTSDAKNPAIYRYLVGAVGIELKATLKTRKLLIPLNEKNAKNSEFAQVRYTAGTRGAPREFRPFDDTPASGEVYRELRWATP